MGNLPTALPPHGTVLAWALGCRREQCECAYQRLVSELALRGPPLRLPAQPEPYKLDASTRARLEPPVGRSECPVWGAPRHQRCRDLAFPQHFAPTHPERRSGPWPGPAAASRQLAGVHGSQPHPATCDELATRDAGCTLFPSARTLPPDGVLVGLEFAGADEGRRPAALPG
jgi:hypothetical protein